MICTKKKVSIGDIGCFLELRDGLVQYIETLFYIAGTARLAQPYAIDYARPAFGSCRTPQNSNDCKYLKVALTMTTLYSTEYIQCVCATM